MNSCKSFLLLGLSFCLVMAGGSQAAAPAGADYDRGVQLGIQGKFTEARAAFEQALKTDPPFIPARNCLGVLDDIQARRIKEQTGVHLFRAFAYFNKSQNDAAIEEFNQAAKLDPKYPLTYHHRGDAWADKDQLAQALADYSRALEIDPRYAPAYLHRGIAYAKQSQYDKAIPDYSRALEINPRYTMALYNRGNAYAQTGRYNEAIADYNRLLDLNPRHGHAYVRKGLACEKAGRKPDALAAYKAYLQKASPQDPQQAQFVREKIQLLEK
ncbi:MAG: tetratricopeptide repeat protein [Deltaproteobacteria bacterium]|nr:tetratricopeptide repeat protein [Deltaproteobacteria bacterium]